MRRLLGLFVVVAALGGPLGEVPETAEQFSPCNPRVQKCN